MRLVLFTCAESAAIDQATNRLSLFHLMEEINTPVFPAVWPRMVVVALGVREENDQNIFSLTLRITLNGQPITQSPFMIDFQNRPKTRTLGQIAGLLLPGPGALRFALSDGDRELAEWNVLVMQIGGATVVTQPVPPPPVQPPPNPPG